MKTNSTYYINYLEAYLRYRKTGNTILRLSELGYSPNLKIENTRRYITTWRLFMSNLFAVMMERLKLVVCTQRVIKTVHILVTYLIFVSQIKYDGTILAGTILENVIVMICILELVLWAHE